LASGQSGLHLKAATNRNRFSTALEQVCQSLARQIMSDGEGVQHVIRLTVGQARTREEALQVARTVAHSMLVKTAWAGADPNWGRILAAIGRSGIAVNPASVSIKIGDQVVCRGGVACAFDEAKAHQTLALPTSEIRIGLGRGRGSAVFLTTDLTAEYVRINADYST
jgi:glutamate N-acetyltransferase/amino-acid N-acetyltransferase